MTTVYSLLGMHALYKYPVISVSSKCGKAKAWEWANDSPQT